MLLSHRFASQFCLLLGLVSAFAPLAKAQVLFGDQSLESSVDSNVRGQSEAFQTTAALSGTLGMLTVYVDSRSTASSLQVGLYSDNNNHPGTLLTQGTIAVPLAGAWNTSAVPQVNVVAGTRYWIALLVGTGTVGTPYFRDRASGSCASETSAQTSLAQLPATWSTGTGYFDCPLSAYGSAAPSNSPVLSVTPLNVSFSATPGGADPAPLTATVTNTGSGTLSFTASSDSAWLTVTPSGGTAPQQLQLAATAAGLALGVYTAHVTIASPGSQGSPATINISLAVSNSMDWLMIEHDPSRSGNTPDETVITTSNVANLQLKWSASVDGPVTAQPLFVSGVQIGAQARDVVIASTGGNSIYALDAATGSTIWRRNFGSQSTNCAIPGGFGVTGTPLIDRTTGRIYTVSNDGVFRTISIATGADVFSGVTVIPSPATNKVWGGLNKVGNYIYFATASDGCDTPPWRGQVYRVDVSGTPTLSGNFVVVPGIAAPSGGGGVWGYGGVSTDPTTGNIYIASAADSNELYTPYANRMIALDANLNLLGSYGPPEPNNFPCNGAPCDLDFGATPLVFQPNNCPVMVLAGNKNGNLYLFRASDLAASSQPLQTLTLNAANDWLGSGGVGGVPAYWPAGNMVFVSDVGPGATGVSGGIVGLSVTSSCTLQVAWSTPLGGSAQPDSTPTVANGIVYVGEGATGKIHAYDAITGTELWNSGSTLYSAAATYAAPSVAQGSIYVGSWSNFTGGGVVGAFSPSSSTPILSVSPRTLSFTVTQGETNPTPAMLSVTNGGTGSLAFAAASDSPWLSVTPLSGSAPQNLQVAVITTNLAASTYTGHITVTSAGAQGSPASITVTLVVSPAAPPVLSVLPTSLSFSAVQGGANPSPSTVNISNSGGGTLSFTTASDSPWLSVSPTSGTAPQSAQVSVNVNGLTTGTYAGHVTITSPNTQGSPASVAVTLTIATSTGTTLLGDTALEPNQDSDARGAAEAFQTTGLTSGTLSSISLYVNSNSTAATWYVGIYSDNNGHPGSLLAQGSKSQLSTAAWNTITVSPMQVTAGATYWIAILGTTSGTPVFRDRHKGPCKSETSRQTTLTSLPATWITGSQYTDCPVSAYGR